MAIVSWIILTILIQPSCRGLQNSLRVRSISVSSRVVQWRNSHHVHPHVAKNHRKALKVTLRRISKILVRIFCNKYRKALKTHEWATSTIKSRIQLINSHINIYEGISAKTLPKSSGNLKLTNKVCVKWSLMTQTTVLSLKKMMRTF